MLETEEINGELLKDIHPVIGGRNNKVFRAKCTYGDVIIKKYFYSSFDTRDRLNTEFNTLKFLWGNGVKNIPEPLFYDKERHTGVYRFINGKRVDKDDVIGMDIEALSELLLTMWKLSRTPGANHLPDASEACFSLKEYCNLLEKRFSYFTDNKDKNSLVIEAYDFVKTDLFTFYQKLKTKVSSVRSLYTRTLSLSERTLSPSDHGFHNALRLSDNSLCFIDFEYSGWDDPVKMVADAFLQPDNAVPQKYYPKFIAAMKPIIGSQEKFTDRFTYVYPLLAIKWSLILLNEFLPLTESRRHFASVPTDELHKKKQLERSRTIYERLKVVYENNTIPQFLSDNT